MTAHNQETALISSIKKEADDEAQRILDNTFQVVEERKKNTDEQIFKIKKENEEKAKQQKNVIALEGERKIVSLKRKQLLALKEKIVHQVLARVKEKFKTSFSEAEVQEMLIDWTVEAALGLAEKDAILFVTDSCRKCVDETFCREAIRRYKEISGEDIAFTLSPTSIKKGYGIILEAKNGKTAYNNLLENRLYRHKDAIEALVLEDIFNE